MNQSIQQHRNIVHQLKREQSIKRMNVSQSARELAAYVQQHIHEDCLVVGFSSQRANPFREKTACTML